MSELHVASPVRSRRLRAGTVLGLIVLALGVLPAGAGAETNPTSAMSDVATTPSAVKPLGVGAKAPSVEVLDAQGDPVALSDIYSSAPTVLIFYRGGWCPYCNVHLGKLTAIEKQLTDAGYQIVAISPDAPQFLEPTAEANKTHYRLLSDSSVEAARAFGLAFRVDDATHERYLKFRKPIDIEARSGGKTHHVLPVPAAYVIDRTGTIRYAYTNPDYKTRVDEKELLQAALEAR